MANRKNLATGTVNTPPSPATSGTSLILSSGQGSRFPNTPFWATLHPDGQLPTVANAEIVEVTNKATDTLTIVRGQRDTTGKSVAVGWRVVNAVYSEDAMPFKSVMQFGAKGDGSTDDTAAIQAAIDDVHNNGGGGTVFFPVGTYRITSALTAYSNMILAGAGTDVTKIVQFTASTTAIGIVDGLYTSIRDMSIRTNGGAHAAGAGIALSWSSNGNVEQMHLQDLLITGFHVGIDAQTLITSQLSNIECFGCDTGIYMHGGGTSTLINNTYMNACGIGYYLDGCVYVSFSATAADSNKQGYYLYNCSGISFNACGSEGGNHTTAPNDGRGWSIDSCVGIGFYNCWNYTNPSYAWYVTNSSSIVLISPTENSPTGTAVNGIFIDSNCARVTIISSNTVTANQTQSGGIITTVIGDNGAASTLPGNLTLGGIQGNLTVNGSSGDLILNASPDGGDYNIFVDATGTLAFYGSAGQTLNLHLLDGTLTLSGDPTSALHAATKAYADLVGVNWHQRVYGVYGTVQSGTFSVFTGSGWYTSSWYESTGAVNDEVRFKVWFPIGTYTFKSVFRNGADKGIVTFNMIEPNSTVTQIGSTIDLYAASGTAQVITTNTAVSISTAGYYTIAYKTASKNASSSNYILPIFFTAIIRTA